MQDTVLVNNSEEQAALHSFVRAFNELPPQVLHGLATASHRVSQMSPQERLKLAKVSEEK